MLLKELNQALFSGSTDSPWIECLDNWVALFCIFLVGISAFWLHDCLEREFQRRLQAELDHLEMLHRVEHENMLNELLALISDPSDSNGHVISLEQPGNGNGESDGLARNSNPNMAN